jgi:hypothetical protein
METKSGQFVVMSRLSLLQVRNLSYNIVNSTTVLPNATEEQVLDFRKQVFKETVPPDIATDVANLQTITTLNSFKTALNNLVIKIDGLIPPIHPPTSYFDILSELVRISKVSDPIDRTILIATYFPLISAQVDVFRVTGGSGDWVLLDALIAKLQKIIDTLDKLTTFDLTTPEPKIKELEQPYIDFRAAYQVARTNVDRTRAGTAYKIQVQNVLRGLSVVFEKLPTTASFMGFYAPTPARETSNTFMVYVDETTDGLNLGTGWTVRGLSGINGTVTIVRFTANVYSDVVVSPGPPAISFPFVSNALVTSDQPNDIRTGSSLMRITFAPPIFPVVANVAEVRGNLSIYDPRLYDDSKIVGTYGRLRELGSNVLTKEGLNVYHTVVDRGAGTGALNALAAIGPQENYMFGGQSHWIPVIKRHTPFALTQRLTLPLKNVGGYLGKVCQVDIFPRESGDLLSSLYLQCSLPALSAGSYYSELIGRALIQKAEFMVDGIVYESITDDWYIIRDQLFLDADEKLGMYKLVSNGTPEGSNVVATSQLNFVIPLEFFFSRRYTHGYKEKKPYFPLCALTNSTVSVRFTFNTQAWITNASETIDILNPRLLIEEVTLDPSEREYFRSRPFTYKVPRVWKEATQAYSSGVVRMNLTANFPVTMMTWFVRNKSYESQNKNFYDSRYRFGYTTDYIVAATPVTFFNGVQLRYIDTIEYATLYLNNNNVLSNFPGGLYYTYKQALDHGLSIPTKNIYMYCFSERPIEYNSGGALDFSQLNSQTTHLDIKFSDKYAAQIASNYSLNLFYYGYVTLEIADGRARLLS